MRLQQLNEPALLLGLTIFRSLANSAEKVCSRSIAKTRRLQALTNSLVARLKWQDRSTSI
jgi:hypothetical protein